MARDLKRASEADLRVVYLHWGDEYSRVPSIAQRRVAAFLRRSGAEIVVGSHPHVVQRTECDSCGLLLYSLGNFVSNQSDRYADGGIIAEVDIVEVESGEFEYFLNVVPVWVHRPDYAVLPVCVGDTLKMSEQQRVSYSRFMSDTQTLFQNM
jgi:poly-gamma-glutamate synthesis protein (capsule biosynthesis protein)